MVDLAAFNKQIDNFTAKEMLPAFVEVHKAVALKFFKSVSSGANQSGFKFGSPQWSGRYRASHTIRIGSIDTSVKPKHPATTGKGRTYWPDDIDSPYKPTPLSFAARALLGLKPFQTIFIANSVPYVRRIEFDGHSLQAPNGVYQVALAQLKSELRNFKLTALLSSTSGVR